MRLIILAAKVRESREILEGLRFETSGNVVVEYFEDRGDVIGDETVESASH